MRTPNVDHSSFGFVNARRPLALLLTTSIVALSLPARADVSLPPPPTKKSTPDLPPPPPPKGSGSGGTPDLPPPPPPQGSGSNGNGSASGKKKGDSKRSDDSGGSSSGSSKERTTGIVLLATGGAVTLVGTTLLLVGAGVTPKGKTSGSNTGMLVAGGVTTGVGLTVAAIGLVLLLNSNNGQLPSFRSLELQHPAQPRPAWESASLSTPGPVASPAQQPAFIVPWTATF